MATRLSGIHDCVAFVCSVTANIARYEFALFHQVFDSVITFNFTMVHPSERSCNYAKDGFDGR